MLGPPAGECLALDALDLPEVGVPRDQLPEDQGPLDLHVDALESRRTPALRVQLLQPLLRERERHIHLEEELRALPEVTRQLQVAPHLPQDLVADRETQPDPVRVQLLVVGTDLPKHLEQLRLVVLVHAHAVVLHR